MDVFPSCTSALVVDDEAAVSQLICNALSAAGFNCRSAANGVQALQSLADEPADLVLTDVRMPGMNGLELLEQVRAHYPDSFVILLTGGADVPTVVRALRSGASDFVTKPFSLAELVERVKSAAEKRGEILVKLEAERQRAAQIDGLQESYRELHEGALSSFQTILDLAHPETNAHSQRVAISAANVAKTMGASQEDIGAIYLAGLLHDLGKVTLEREIVVKPGTLDPDEKRHMESHVERSAKIVSSVPLPPTTLDAIRHHHERFDGTGYPERLRGKEIPFAARVLAVCDAFDAMTSERAYKTALPSEEGVSRLRSGAGIQWDPVVIDVFCALQAQPSVVLQGDVKDTEARATGLR